MKIRRGKEADIEEATRLYYGIWPKDKIIRVRKYFKEKVRNKEIFVAVEKNRIIGIISFTKRYFKSSDYLDEVIVAKECQRKGIAKKLIKSFEKDAKRRKSCRVFSSTQLSNKKALNLHRKIGYKRAGYLDHMWKEGQREIIFSKKLK